MDKIKDLYERYKSGEHFSEPFSQKKVGTLNAKDPTEIAPNNQVVQDMLKKHSPYFQKTRPLV